MNERATVNVYNSQIKDNWAMSNGGALYCEHIPVSYIINDTILTHNKAENGGGMFCKGKDATCVIVGNTVFADIFKCYEYVQISSVEVKQTYLQFSFMSSLKIFTCFTL